MDITKLSAAFIGLRKHGYFARQNWACCDTCGWYNIPEGKSSKTVFYNQQASKRFRLGHNLFLAWSGDGDEICKVIESAGLQALWSGSELEKIEVVNDTARVL